MVSVHNIIVLFVEIQPIGFDSLTSKKNILLLYKIEQVLFIKLGGPVANENNTIGKSKDCRAI